jgi:hypothetical protein
VMIVRCFRTYGDLHLSPRNSRHQVDFSVCRQFGVPLVAVDFSVNGDRYTPLDMGLHAGPGFAQYTEQFADGCGLYRNRRGAASQWPQRPPEMDLNLTQQNRPGRLGLAAFIAFRMRGGDIGTCVMRTPVALEMALPIAASGGTIGVSPTPRTP